MNYSADELFDELARLDATLEEVSRRAGQGQDPDCQRALQGHARLLRNMLGEEFAALTVDVMEAADRVLEAADPRAPLMALGLVRDNIAAVVRRLAAAATFPSAA